MEQTVSAQVYLQIAGIETPGVKMGRGIMGNAEYRHLDVLTYLNLGRTMLSRGVYGKYRIDLPVSVGIREKGDHS
jgi:hypothetical protein